MFIYGERVRVILPKESVYIPPHMYDYQGKEAMVERVHFFGGQRAYELLGVTSPKGKMYTFEESWLELIGKEQNDETDG